jgi:predicted nuclease of restriction endonuclease-like (RecB) superfamily
MLGRMRVFYLACPRLRSQIPSSLMTGSPLPIPSSPMTESAADGPPPLQAAGILRLSWTHWIDLLRLEDPWRRAFYEQECLRGGWSVRQLQRQIGSLLYERTGLSTDKRAIIAEARVQATESPQTIGDLIRDPYVLEFTGLAVRPAYRETDLETAILDHLQAFLLELGGGFCFEARQRRITVGNEHDWIDLVFYHRRLRCHLLIDLKTRAFQHGDAGQMNFYLNWWKDHEAEDGDQPPVGLLLCAGKDQAKVHYATAGIDHHLFVSRYLVALPSAEDLQRLLDADQAAWQQRQPTEPRP